MMTHSTQEGSMVMKAYRKMMRLKNCMGQAVTTTDYNFYRELYTIAILQYRKVKN